MIGRKQGTKLARGMTLAFKREALKELADIPARVIDVWPRFRSGDYLVTLEYAQPVQVEHDFIRHIEAFASELYQVEAAVSAPRVAPRQTTGISFRLAWNQLAKSYPLFRPNGIT